MTSEPTSKKLLKETKKKTDICDKEVLALTGGLYPIALQQPKKQISTQIMIDKDNTSWVMEDISINSGAIKPGFHWVPKENQNQPYVGSKYDIQVEIIQFDKQDYQKYLQILDPTWSYEETQYLFELCRNFDCRFIVVHDRYTFQKREISDLKDRFYVVNSKILQSRQQTTNPLSNYTFDALYDQKRIYELEKYLKRDKQILEDEKKWMEEIKKVDVLIKKQEKEQLSLRKTIKMENINDDEIDEEEVVHLVRLNVENKQQLNTVMERFVYLRSQWVNEAFPMPIKVQKKLDNWIKELLQLQPGSRIVLTQETEELYDKLRHSLLSVFSQQRQEKKRQQEKRLLEEKVQKLKSSIENQGQVPNGTSVADVKTKK